VTDRAAHELGHVLIEYDNHTGHDPDGDPHGEQKEEEIAVAFGNHYICTSEGIYLTSSLRRNKVRQSVKWIHPCMHLHVHNFIKVNVLSILPPAYPPRQRLTIFYIAPTPLVPGQMHTIMVGMTGYQFNGQTNWIHFLPGSLSFLSFLI
jgi:hypothetical protein